MPTPAMRIHTLSKYAQIKMSCDFDLFEFEHEHRTLNYTVFPKTWKSLASTRTRFRTAVQNQRTDLVHRARRGFTKPNATIAPNDVFVINPTRKLLFDVAHAKWYYRKFVLVRRVMKWQPQRTHTHLRETLCVDLWFEIKFSAESSLA